MTIAVIGTGNVGGTLGMRLAACGYDVVFGSRRPDSDDVQTLVNRAGAHARATQPDEAVEGADVVFLATPWNATGAVLASLGALGDTVLVDCTNPIRRGFSLVAAPSGGEQVAAWSNSARVVKAFNTTGWENMADPDYGDHRLAMFYCGDDEEAKQTVASLIDALGFEPIDAGPLKRSAYLEALAMLWITQAMEQGSGRDFGFGVLRR